MGARSVVIDLVLVSSRGAVRLQYSVAISEAIFVGIVGLKFFKCSSS